MPVTARGAAIMKHAQAEHPALAVMRGVDHLLRKHERQPSPELVNQARAQVADAMDLLSVRDPLRRKAGLIFLALVEATSVEERTIRGKVIVRVTIKDQQLYTWAIARVHEFATTGV